MSKRAALLRSLRWRLLAATFVAVSVAVAIAGAVLSGLSREHVTRQFAATLTAELDQVTARFEPDAAGTPRLDPAGLSDPRWVRPYSGLYWWSCPVSPDTAYPLVNA